jgi:hypothetical protein
LNVKEIFFQIDLCSKSFQWIFGYSRGGWGKNDYGVKMTPYVF